MVTVDAPRLCLVNVAERNGSLDPEEGPLSWHLSRYLSLCLSLKSCLPAAKPWFGHKPLLPPTGGAASGQCPQAEAPVPHLSQA